MIKFYSCFPHSSLPSIRFLFSLFIVIVNAFNAVEQISSRYHLLHSSYMQSFLGLSLKAKNGEIDRQIVT